VISTTNKMRTNACLRTSKVHYSLISYLACNSVFSHSHAVSPTIHISTYSTDERSETVAPHFASSWLITYQYRSLREA